MGDDMFSSGIRNESKQAWDFESPVIEGVSGGPLLGEAPAPAAGVGMGRVMSSVCRGSGHREPGIDRGKSEGVGPGVINPRRQSRGEAHDATRDG